MTLPQIISMVSIVLLTTVAVIVAIQLIYLLKELRYSVMRINQTIDSVSDTIEKISQPAVGMFAILEGFKESGKIVETISRLLGRDKPKPPVDIDSYDNSL
jgi:hypothetical protein